MNLTKGGREVKLLEDYLIISSIIVYVNIPMYINNLKFKSIYPMLL